MTSQPYSFPPIYDFPPFFTRQPTESTWHNQLKQWIDLILDYTRHKRCYKIDLRETTAPATSWDLFHNKRIKRRLAFETLQEIIEEMVLKGEAEWNGGSKGSKTHALIYWRKPDEWAKLVWDWINRTGQNNSIVTLYEIAHGTLAQDEEFYDIDKDVLIKSINILVKRGVAQTFKGTSNDDDMGVKFFGVQ